MKTSILAVIVSAAMFLFASCDRTEEDFPPSDAAPTTSAATPTPDPTPSPAPTTSAWTPTPSPTGIPDSWQTYVDPILGFSLRYPPDLQYTDSGQPGPSAGWRERDIIFRATADAKRPGFAIAIVANDQQLTLEQWTATFAACIPETVQQDIVAGEPAIACTSEAGEVPVGVVVFHNLGSMFLVSSRMPPSELDLIVGSVRLAA